MWRYYLQCFPTARDLGAVGLVIFPICLALLSSFTQMSLFSLNSNFLRTQGKWNQILGQNITGMAPILVPNRVLIALRGLVDPAGLHWPLFSLHSGLLSLPPERPTNLSLQHFRASLSWSSTLFHIPLLNQRQRLTDHVARFITATTLLLEPIFLFSSRCEKKNKTSDQSNLRIKAFFWLQFKGQTVTVEKSRWQS